MNRATYLINATLLGTMLALSGPACSHGDEEPGYTEARRTPDSIDRAAIKPKFRGEICVAHLEVDIEGAHLREGHVLVMIGPLPWSGAYLVFAAHPGIGSSADPLAWETKPYFAFDTGLVDADDDAIYMINPVRVLETSGEHTDWTTHPMNLVIKALVDNCPTEVDIHAYPHYGILGFHGGRAHANN